MRSSLPQFIVIASPDSDYLIAAKEHIEKNFPKFTVLLADDPIQTINHMHALTGPALYLIDQELPDMYGDMLVRHIKKSSRFEEECCILTEGNNHEVMEKALESGAWFFSKTPPPGGTHYNVGTLYLKLIKFLHEKMKKQVADSLTGVCTRDQGLELWKHEFVRAKRKKTSISGIFVDVNYLKKVNDTFGHDAGDEIIKAVAQLLKSHIRDSFDFVIRLGGDEFFVVLSETKSTSAVNIAKRMQEYAKQLKVHTQVGWLRVSIATGVSVLRPAYLGTDPEKAFKTLTSRADASMYKNKAAMKTTEEDTFCMDVVKEVKVPSKEEKVDHRNNTHA